MTKTKRNTLFLIGVAVGGIVAVVYLTTIRGGDNSVVADDSPASNMTGDWPMWGGTTHRNNVPEATGIPTDWNVGEFDRNTGEWIKDDAKHIKWQSRLGSQSYGNYIVADGRV